DPKDKLINAKYCAQFAHVAWPDGTIRHVHVTPELHRDYERRVHNLLEKVKFRLQWLKKGSRDVFGTVLEQNIYILIDTSKSMQNHLSFVKDKILLLLQDQLYTKERVNIIAFNTVINPWRDRLTKISDSTTYSQILPWIQSLNAEGSTNTLAALRFALADTQTEAIYLLTDGRPDQSERHILSQVQYRHSIPVHTIAFNCQDLDANQFLYNLSKQTGGRFHAFNYGFINHSIELPESEDISLLKQELIRGEIELKRVSELRDECIGRTWSKENIHKSSKYKNRDNTPAIPLLQLKNQNTITATYRPNSSLSNQASTINLNPDQRPNEFLSGNNENSRIETTDNEALSTGENNCITPDAEVKLFLKKNNLVAKHLTIFDILQPSSVTVKSEYVQSIDRYVLSKVWDDILPLAHGSYVGKLRLINHLAVDLITYEKDLNTLLKLYLDFTSKIIWKYLSEEQKRKLAPQIYWNSLGEKSQNEEEKEKKTILIKSDSTNFTITSNSVTFHLFERSVLRDNAWRKLTADEQQNFIENPPRYDEDNKILLQNALDESKSLLKIKSVLKLDREIKKAVKFLQISTDLRKHQKRDKVEEVKSKTVIRRQTYPFMSPGQRVIVRYDVDGFFYPGTILRTKEDQATVLLDRGPQQQAEKQLIFPTNGAVNQLSLYINDCVLARFDKANFERWVPAVVHITPPPCLSVPQLYTVHLYIPELCVKIDEQIDIMTYDKTLSSGRVKERKNEFSQTRLIPTPPISRSDTPVKQEITHRDHSAQTTSRLPISGPTPAASLRSSIAPGTEVLCRWEDDDGLFYWGSVIEKYSDYQYVVERNKHVKSLIHQDDIYLPEDFDTDLKSESFVIALYPDLRNSRAPGVLISSTKITDKGEEKITVRFYDCTEVDVIVSEIIPIITKNNNEDEKFKQYVECIIQKEKSIVDQVVVGRNDDVGAYMLGNHVFDALIFLYLIQAFCLLGTVEERVGNGHQYRIRWCDDTKTVQELAHLFGAFIRQGSFRKRDKILALDEMVYKPATIIHVDRNSLTIQFFDGRRETKISSDATFQITEEYYDDIIKNSEH
ncbi:unnamed protein product, partial [Didymodactylos carnosus]